jgi:hypothetical protein
LEGSKEDVPSNTSKKRILGELGYWA